MHVMYVMYILYQCMRWCMEGRLCQESELKFLFTSVYWELFGFIETVAVCHTTHEQDDNHQQVTLSDLCQIFDRDQIKPTGLRWLKKSGAAGAVGSVSDRGPTH